MNVLVRGEIGDTVGLRSSSSVSRHLASLEEKGFLRRGATVSRPIDVRAFLPGSPPGESGGDSVAVPVVGDIAAWIPILAEEYVDDLLRLPGGAGTPTETKGVVLGAFPGLRFAVATVVPTRRLTPPHTAT